MKLQVKLDKASIQEFFLQHGEKFAFGLVALLFVWILYDAAAGKKTLEASWIPSELSKKAASKSKDIEDAPAAVDVQVPDLFSKENKRVRLREDLFVSKHAFDPPLFERKPLRDRPPILAVEQLRGVAEVGPFNKVKDPMAAAMVPGAAESEKDAHTRGSATRGSTTRGTTTRGTAARGTTTRGNAARGNRAPTRDDDEEMMRGMRGMMQQPMGMAMPAARADYGPDAVGKRWISLVGLVPLEKQEEAYRKTFQNAAGFDPSSAIDNYPMYRDCKIERIEVTTPEEAANPDWSKAKSVRLMTAIDSIMRELQWSAASDAVLAKYLDPAFTFPLPQLLSYRQWDASAAHAPEIPVVERFGGNMMGPGGMQGGMMRMNGRMDDEEDGPRGMGPGSGRPGMMMGRPGAERPNMMSPMGQRGMMQQQPEQRIDPFTGEPIAPNEEEEEARKAREEAMEKEQKPPEFKLFRFLDFNVEAGKSYMYRVCLAVENPNYQRQAVFLANPSDKDSQFLVGEWSEPSPVITVPPDSRLLVKTVKLSPSSITAVLTKWLVDKGIEAFTEPQAFYRGQLANLMGQSFEPTVAAHAAPMAGMYGGPGPGGMGGGMMAGGSGSAPARGAMAGGSGSAPPRAAAGGGSGSAPSRAGAAAGRNPAAPVGNNNDAEPIDVDYVTNVVVVDFRGGGKLPGRKDPVTEPAEVLLLDLNGNLTVRSEVDDLAAINEVTGVVEEPEPSATAGQGGVSPFGLENALGGGNNKKTPKKTGSGRGAN